MDGILIVEIIIFYSKIIRYASLISLQIETFYEHSSCVWKECISYNIPNRSIRLINMLFTSSVFLKIYLFAYFWVCLLFQSIGAFRSSHYDLEIVSSNSFLTFSYILNIKYYMHSKNWMSTFSILIYLCLLIFICVHAFPCFKISIYQNVFYRECTFHSFSL